MKPKYSWLDKHRLREGFYGNSEDKCSYGCFIYEGHGYNYKIISSGDNNPHSEWEHVSVSKTRGKNWYLPTWEDMCFVKQLFWDEEETVLQFHPKKSEYVNKHPCVL